METGSSIRILFVEDLPSDTELAERELSKEGISFESLRVETREAMMEALETYRPDVVVSDYSMPRFDGMQALELCRQYDSVLPFIVLTGSMNEKTAVACMKAGASDYVIKEHITRLPFAVKEALKGRRILEEKRTADLALRASEERFRRLAENAPDIVYRVLVHPALRFEYISPAAAAITGYTPEEYYADPGLGFRTVHPEDRGLFEAAVRGELGLDRPLSLRLHRKDGTVIWTEHRNVPVFDESGDGIVAIEGIARDVTEQRLAEKNLQETNEELEEAQQRLALQARWVRALNSVARDIARRHTLESILGVVMRYLEENFAFAVGGINLRREDGQGSTVVALSSRGRSLARRLGVREGTAVPAVDSLLPAGPMTTEPSILSVSELDPAALPGPAGALFGRIHGLGLNTVVVVPLAAEAVRSGAIFMLYRRRPSLAEAELEFLRGMAEQVSLAVRSRLLFDELEDSYRRLQETQQAMMSQERMKAMGQMASGIAHDINNTLAPITLYAEALASGELGQKEPARRYLATILSAASDIEGITMRLRAFYKEKEQGEMELLDIEELFDSVLELSRPRWKDIPNRRGVEIRVKRKVASRLPPLYGALAEVREALVNLVFNAVDALSQGGAIELRARKREEHLCVEVADTGTGMDEEQRRRCLEPFYTTKGAEGSGLGLSIVFAAMQRHGGGMEVESEPERGTTVRLLFPLPHRRRARAAPAGAAVTAELPPLRILCIDDNAKLREALKEMLAGAGHRVTACIDGEDALSAFRSEKDAGNGFDVVITDLGMPHMDGRTLARRIKEDSPGTPVILLSGWGHSMNVDEELPEDIDCLVAKPPTMARLLAAIREVLGPAGSNGVGKGSTK